MRQLFNTISSAFYLVLNISDCLEIIAHRLVADELLDYDSFIAPPLHDEPYTGLWRLAMDRATVEFAASINAATMLTGIGADEIHEMHPYYLSDLLRKCRLIEAWQEAIKWARAKNSNAWNILQHFGFNPLVTVWFPFLSGQTHV